MIIQKRSDKYSWTNHALMKLRYYGLSENRIKRVIRFPKRIEEGIVEHTIAAMQPAGAKRYQEIWVMYKLAKQANSKSQTLNPKSNTIKIITAWRYPGKSPARDPIPQEIIREVQSLL